MNNTMVTLAENSEGLAINIGFKPGPSTNVEIARLLGFDARLFGGQAYFCQDGDMFRCMDYCNTSSATLDRLDELGVIAFSKPTTSKKWIAFFERDGNLYITDEYSKESQAFASVLLYVLENKS